MGIAIILLSVEPLVEPLLRIAITMEIDHTFNPLEYHLAHPLDSPSTRRSVIYRIADGAEGTYVHDAAEFIAIMVDGFMVDGAAKPPELPLECLDGLTDSLLRSNAFYPKATHLGVHDESMSVEAK